MPRVRWLVLALVALAGCDEIPGAEPKGKALLGTKAHPSSTGSVAPNERRCHLKSGAEGVAPVPLVSELGQKLEVASGTPCVVLDTGAALTRVRIVQGPYVDAVAWVQSRVVVAEKAGP